MLRRLLYVIYEAKMPNVHLVSASQMSLFYIIWILDCWLTNKTIWRWALELWEVVMGIFYGAPWGSHGRKSIAMEICAEGWANWDHFEVRLLEHLALRIKAQTNNWCQKNSENTLISVIVLSSFVQVQVISRNTSFYFVLTHTVTWFCCAFIKRVQSVAGGF